MTIDEIKAAIAADTSLAVNFAKWASEQNISLDDLTIKEGYQAWDWCRIQLVAKGMPELHADAIRSVYMSKAKYLGTYEAIRQCIFGEDDTTTLIIG